MACEVSKNDSKVLQMIFNPNMPVGDAEDQANLDEKSDEDRFDVGKLAKVKELEITGVKHAEEQKIDEAIKCFTEAIEILPDYPSAYNNRAQAFRMKAMNIEAYSDLGKAISLSEGNGQAASLAYTQRGLLRKLDGDEKGSLEDFENAAKLGNAFAKQQVVNANPYAALCNNMLTSVFNKLKSGVPDDQ